MTILEKVKLLERYIAVDVAAIEKRLSLLQQGASA